MTNSERNPFAAPKTSDASLDPENSGAEGQGVWRKGKKTLVMTRSARLPNRCIKCGQSDTVALDRTIYWHPPAYYLLALLSIPIYLIVYLIVRRTAKVSVPLCRRHNTRRRAGLFVLAGSFAALFAGVGLGAATDNPVGPLLGILAFFIGLIVGLAWSSVMKPAKIDEQYIHAYVAPPFLEGLAVFPEPYC
ncbi:MAG: hypothetical protein IPK13_00850 [Deltaproteobacteria bacterium]|nr:hypothetical protein [Deltaproteobacteria bacterium]